MRVELLWWEGCPSHPEALAQLKKVLSEEGLEAAEIESRRVDSDEQAASERFPGSPTIRIDGEDAVQPAAGDVSGLSCRVYRLRDGRPSPTPDPEDLRDALRRARAPA
jgi:hypothetical protein